MYAENLVVDHDAQRQVIEHIGEIVPNISIAVLPSALSVKAVGLGYTPRFVVAADEVYSVRVSEFQADKKGYGLDTKETAIHVVAYTSIWLVLSLKHPLE